MSVETTKPSHHTEDWSRSSFFDFNSEMVKDLHLQSDSGSDSLALDSTFYSVDDKVDIHISDNPVMNEIMQNMIDRFAKLVKAGELAPTFMNKMTSNPEEIIAFIQENHATIGDKLNDKLDPETRPSIQQMVQRGIIPNQYYPSIKIITASPCSPSQTSLNVQCQNDNRAETVTSEPIVVELDINGEKSKGELVNKDEKIEELTAVIIALKAREKERQISVTKGKHHFSASYSALNMENKRDLEHIGEIEAIKNEYNKLLSEMKGKQKELEQKYLNAMRELQDVEQSKVALLSVFNCEMDRMRAEIKKCNSFKMKSTAPTPRTFTM